MKSTLLTAEPKNVAPNELEDMLATDRLFVDYFNKFLALPSFPEPLVFNCESGGFEIRTQHPERLAKEIKAAARAGRKIKRLYYPVRHNAYSDIPLIPIEDENETTFEIDTSFTVQTLNKEQGIEWVRKQRLPGFLQSNLYSEYRLAKLVAQSKLVQQNPGRHFILNDLVTTQKPVETEQTNAEKEALEEKQLMSAMFVSMGQAPTTDTEAWVRQARAAHLATTKTASAVGPKMAAPKPTFAEQERPISARADRKRGFSVAENASHALLPAQSRPHSAATEFSLADSGADVGDGFESEGAPDTITFKSLEEAGSVIVACAIKHALCSVTGLALNEVQCMTSVSKLFPRPHFISITKEHLEMAECSIGDDVKPDKSNAKPITDSEDIDMIEVDKESDSDSLFNSDDDYEDENEAAFFRKAPKTPQTGNFMSLKDVQKFKDMLEGTTGEKLWNFWQAIDKISVSDEETNQSRYLVLMKEQYLNPGAPLQLSEETKVELGLNRTSNWSAERLLSAQRKIVKPLLFYWAPRFLLQSAVSAEPKQYSEYRAFTEASKPTDRQPAVIHKTPPLLPLRPKNCMPKLGSDVKVTPAIDVEIKSTTAPGETTTPSVGMRRTWQRTTMFPTPPSSSSNAAKDEKSWATLHPKEFMLKRQRNAMRRSQSALERKSGANALQKRPASAQGLKTTTNGEDKIAAKDNRRLSLQSTSSAESVYAGGRRMAGLLGALSNESKSGGFLRNVLNSHGNLLWLNCLNFWEELQQYHEMFYAKTLDVFQLKLKSKKLFSSYVNSSAKQSIQCPVDIRIDISKRLNPPYEELFDAAEEHVLTELFEAWIKVISTDQSTFDRVELVDVKRHLRTKSAHLSALQRRGIVKQRPPTPDEELFSDEKPIFDPTMVDKVPEEFKDFYLEKLVHNRIELEHFRTFLEENYASIDLLCWTDIEAFKRLGHTDEKRRDAKAKDIKVKYLNKKYFFGPNSPASREGQNKVMQAGGGWGKLLDDRPPTPCLIEAQKYVKERLEKKWLPLFLCTEDFADRQRPKSSMSEVVEDVLIHRKKKSQPVWKMLEKSKFITSSKDIIIFRKALLNPITCQQFRKFVSIKRENNYENDVLFWLEVQRYKDMCHVHAEKALLQQKIATIINCFLDSPIPPQLQVDIPQETADKILEKKLDPTPYLFRDSQMTIFRILFALWNEFSEFRAKLTDSKILPTLERHRRKLREEERRKARDAEEREKREQKKADDDANFDPFDVASDTGSATGEGRKDQINWSYSTYMDALEREDVLNTTDQNTFKKRVVVEPIPEEAVKESKHTSQTSENRPQPSVETDSKEQEIRHQSSNRRSSTSQKTLKMSSETQTVINGKSKENFKIDVAIS